MSWIDDTQGAVKPGSTPEECVIEGKPKPGTPVAARFSTPATAEANYFEVTVVNLTQDGAFVGITTEAGFKKGYGLQACLFGGPGNLSTGIALAKSGFGPAVKTGSVIGFLVDFVQEGEAKKVNATIYMDGVRLGLAFTATLKDPATTAVYPVVQASKDGDRFACKFLPAPEGVGTAAPGHPAEGAWVVQAMRLGAPLAVWDFAGRMSGRPIPVKVSKGEANNTFDFNWTVVNEIKYTAGADNATLALTSEVVSGRMAGEEAEMELEQALITGLETVTEWTPTSSTLLLKGASIEVELGRAPVAAPGASEKAAFTDVVLP